MQLKRSKRKSWELVVVALAVAGAMGMSLALYAKRDQVAKEQLLILELETLRNRVMAHMLTTREIPESLEFIRDPFGNLYNYNPETGWVSSATKGYWDW